MLGIFGDIQPPLTGSYASVITGLPLLISNIVRLITVVAGIWMFFNIIAAGFIYLTAAGDREKLTRALNMIWHSIVGLVIIMMAFAIAGVISQLLYGDPGTILRPVIYGPGRAGPEIEVWLPVEPVD